MINCLKPSQANSVVFLPVASGNDVKSSTFQTLHLEPFELTLVCPWSGLGSCSEATEKATDYTAFEMEETTQFALLQTTTGSH